MTDQEFLDRLSRKEKIGAPGTIGSAFHAAFEQWMNKLNDGAWRVSLDRMTGESDGATVEFVFTGPDGDGMDVTVPAYLLAERDIEIPIETRAGWVLLRGKIDGLFGMTVRDLKTTKHAFNMAPKMERFQDSWQWRAYLLAMGAEYRRFEYHLFSLKYGVGVERAVEARTPARVAVVGFHPFSCYRYDRMEADLQSVAGDVAAFARERGWAPPPKREMAIF